MPWESIRSISSEPDALCSTFKVSITLAFSAHHLGHSFFSPGNSLADVHCILLLSSFPSFSHHLYKIWIFSDSQDFFFFKHKGQLGRDYFYILDIQLLFLHFLSSSLLYPATIAIEDTEVTKDYTDPPGLNLSCSHTDFCTTWIRLNDITVHGNTIYSFVLTTFTVFLDFSLVKCFFLFLFFF